MDVSTKVISDLKKHKKSAFNIVYYKYYRLVYYQALEIVKNEDVAQDVMQDTFLKLMQDIDNYQDKGCFKQYLMTIAKNCAINAYQKRKRNMETLSLTDNMSYKEDTSKYETIVTLGTLLSNEEAEIVYKKVILEESFQQIADEKNQTIGMIQAKYYKALKMLKKYY